LKLLIILKNNKTPFVINFNSPCSLFRELIGMIEIQGAVVVADAVN
jgi:hypothetical protein